MQSLGRSLQVSGCYLLYSWKRILRANGFIYLIIRINLPKWHLLSGTGRLRGPARPALGPVREELAALAPGRVLPFAPGGSRKRGPGLSQEVKALASAAVERREALRTSQVVCADCVNLSAAQGARRASQARSLQFAPFGAP